MKKYFLVAICALLLFVVTGCGKKNQVVCSQEMTESGMKVKGEITADIDDSNKVKDVSISMDFENSTIADSMCALYKQFITEEGVSVSCSGTKMTVTGMASLDTEEDEDEVIGMAKEDFIKKAEAEGYTCK